MPKYRSGFCETYRQFATVVVFYLYPTVSTALIHLVKPGLMKWD